MQTKIYITSTIPHKVLQDIANGKNAVKTFREFRKATQAKLAEEAGVSRQYIFQIENNQRTGATNVLKKIAAALDVDVDLLII